MAVRLRGSVPVGPLPERRPRQCVSCGSFPPPHRIQAIEGISCVHESLACTHCWRSWLQEKLNSQAPNKITCIQCDNHLTHADIRALGGEEIYQRFLDLEFKFALSSDEHFRFCMNSLCRSGQIHEDGNIFECQECGHRHCVACQMPWHAGVTCKDSEEMRKRASDAVESRFKEDMAERDEKQAENEASERTVERVTKSCPKCKRRIEKDGGCEHMKCSVCEHEFCWLCLVDYGAILDEGNHHHDKHCILWRPPPGDWDEFLVDNERGWPEEGIDGMDEEEYLARARHEAWDV